MTRWLVGLFFIAHGLVHLAIWLSPLTPTAPFNPSRSWLLGLLGISAAFARSLAIVLAVVAALGFVLAGVGWLTAHGWGRPLALWSAALSLALVVLYFHPWFLFVVLIDLAIIYGVRR